MYAHTLCACACKTLLSIFFNLVFGENYCRAKGALRRSPKMRREPGRRTMLGRAGSLLSPKPLLTRLVREKYQRLHFIMFLCHPSGRRCTDEVRREKEQALSSFVGAWYAFRLIIVFGCVALNGFETSIDELFFFIPRGQVLDLPAMKMYFALL